MRNLSLAIWNTFWLPDLSQSPLWLEKFYFSWCDVVEDIGQNRIKMCLIYIIPEKYPHIRKSPNKNPYLGHQFWLNLYNYPKWGFFEKIVWGTPFGVNDRHSNVMELVKKSNFGKFSTNSNWVWDICLLLDEI